MTHMKRIAAVIAAAMVAVGMSACSVTGQDGAPDAAATWDGHTVTVDEVAAWDQAAIDLGLAPHDGSSLTLLVLKPTIETYADEHNLKFNDDQVELQVQAILEEFGDKDAEINDAMRDFVHTVRLFSLLLSDEDFVTKLQEDVTAFEANATVSPMFGAFDMNAFLDSLSLAYQAANDPDNALGEIAWAEYRTLDGFPAANPDWVINPTAATTEPTAASPEPSAVG